MEIVHFIPPNQRRLVMLAAQTDTAPVLIHGHNGTGKGFIARWIHEHGPRAGHPFITADSNIPLVEQLPYAQGGTIFILEIGERTLTEQKVLLNYLKTRTIPHPHDPSTRMLLNSRIIVSTSQNLEGRAQGGLFNLELLKKLNVFRIEMPELSSRREEFGDIVHGILSEITHELHKEHLRTVTPDALEQLMNYRWPGNIRELRNVLRVAAISAKTNQLEASDLPDLTNRQIDFTARREAFEKTYILELLKTFDWKIDRTCQVSRIDKNTLLSKIRRYGIQLDSLRDEGPGL